MLFRSGQARTGTGKTLGFGIPIIDQVDAKNIEGAPPQALVVVPTRELCLQVATDLEVAGKQRKVRVLALYGGRAFEPQIESLQRGVDIVVGTPGRLIDLYQQGHIKLSDDFNRSIRACQLTCCTACTTVFVGFVVRHYHFPSESFRQIK